MPVTGAEWPYKAVLHACRSGDSRALTPQMLCLGCPMLGIWYHEALGSQLLLSSWWSTCGSLTCALQTDALCLGKALRCSFVGGLLAGGCHSSAKCCPVLSTRCQTPSLQSQNNFGFSVLWFWIKLWVTFVNFRTTDQRCTHYRNMHISSGKKIKKTHSLKLKLISKYLLQCFVAEIRCKQVSYGRLCYRILKFRSLQFSLSVWWTTFWHLPCFTWQKTDSHP